jgi:hypothetical protein
MTEEDEDESPYMDMDKTDEEVQDTSLAFDNNLDSEVDDFTIEEDDCVFMVVVHPVDPHHFVHASSTVSRCLVEVFAKNSKPKGFEYIVLTSLHTYADILSETAFDSLPECRKWDHAIELECEPSPGDMPQAPYPHVDRSQPKLSDAYWSSYTEYRCDDSSHTQSRQQFTLHSYASNRNNAWRSQSVS